MFQVDKFDVRRIAKLLIVGLIVAFGLALWSAGPANANCPASDPNCMGDGMSNPTSPPATHYTPPQTSPPVTSNQSSNSGSSHSTSPPRTAATSRHTPATQPRQAAQTPVVATPTEDFVTAPTETAVIQPGPAIALSGDAPAGAGTAASVGPPPAQPESSGAGTVLWGFAIGAGFVGIGIGAAATLRPSGAPVGSYLEAVR